VRLSELYASPLPAEQKREEKRAVLAALAAELGARRPLNNATLVQFRVYNSGAPALSALLSSCGGSLYRPATASKAERGRARLDTANVT
jgi:predicted aminopeptidase